MLRMKEWHGVAKWMSRRLYFPINSSKAMSIVEGICAEFPEVKLIRFEHDTGNQITIFEIKFPVKLRQNIELYLNKEEVTKELVE